MIRISILSCSTNALSSPYNATTTKSKYKRIVGDKSVDGLWFDRRDLIFNWFWIVTKTRRWHYVHLCLTRFQTKLRWELDQLRVGQFYCRFWPIFSLLFIVCRPRAHNFHNRNARQLAWFETEWKVCFWTRYFPLFPLLSYLCSRHSHGKTTNTDHASMFEYINRVTMGRVTKCLTSF